MFDRLIRSIHFTINLFWFSFNLSCSCFGVSHYIQSLTNDVIAIMCHKNPPNMLLRKLSNNQKLTTLSVVVAIVIHTLFHKTASIKKIQIEKEKGEERKKKQSIRKIEGKS